jgi:hypothetical protein
MTERIIGGQKIVITDGGNFLFTIRNGLFFSAGKLYKFPYNSPGVGINEEIVMTALAENRYILLSVNGNLYITNPTEIIEVVNYYKSKKNEKGRMLYIIPVKSLRRLGG